MPVGRGQRNGIETSWGQERDMHCVLRVHVSKHKAQSETCMHNKRTKIAKPYLCSAMNMNTHTKSYLKKEFIFTFKYTGRSKTLKIYFILFY